MNIPKFSEKIKSLGGGGQGSLFIHIGILLVIALLSFEFGRLSITPQNIKNSSVLITLPDKTLLKCNT